jgi:hypothetical protein
MVLVHGKKRKKVMIAGVIGNFKGKEGKNKTQVLPGCYRHIKEHLGKHQCKQTEPRRVQVCPGLPLE